MSERSLFSLKNPVMLYFLFALTFTWLFWIPTLVIAANFDYYMPSILTFNQLISEGFVDELHMITFLLNQIGVYGPLIAAFTVIAITKKKDGLTNWFKSIIKVKVHIKWYGIIIILPFIIFFLGSLLSGVNPLNMFNIGMTPLLVFLMFINNTFTSGLEEPGWRGYALPVLQEKYNAYKSSIILGTFWAIWHYPYLIYLYLTQIDMPIFLAIISLVGFTASTMGISIIYTWIYNNNRSVFISILFHVLLNFVPQIMLGGITDSAGGVFTALVTWGIAIILTRKFGEQTLVKLTDEEIKKREEKKKKKQEKKKA